MARNALFTSINGNDYVFYTKNSRKSKNDSEKVANIMATKGYTAPSEYWKNKTMLVEVEEPKVIGGKVFKDFKEKSGTYQGSFMPQEGNLNEYYLNHNKSTGHLKDF